MARPLRIQYPGAFYHITGKGYEGRRIFLSPADYLKFKEYLLEARDKFHTVVHAYILLPDAYQLILETREANLSRFMHHLAGSYTTYFNSKRGLAGRLFRGRYKAILIDEKSLLLELSRHMHLDPVRARLVKKPEEYRHSSFGAYVLKERQELVSTEAVLGTLSSDPGKARKKYRGFVEHGLEEKAVNPLQEVHNQAIAGTPSFIKKVTARVNKEEAGRKSTSRFTTARQASRLELILDGVSSYFKVPSRSLLNGKSMARNLAIYLAKRYTGLTNNEIGVRFGNITYSAVSRVAGRVEERKAKDKTLQTHLNRIEERLDKVKA
jgi:putative transposase